MELGYEIQVPRFTMDVQMNARYEVTIPGDFLQRASTARLVNPEFKLAKSTIMDILFPEIISVAGEQAKINAEDAVANPIFRGVMAISEFQRAAQQARAANDEGRARLLDRAAQLLEGQVLGEQGGGGGGGPLDALPDVVRQLQEGRSGSIMTTRQQPPTPSEVPFQSPLRTAGPAVGPLVPGTSRGPGRGILRDPDPEQIFPGFGDIGRRLDLQLVQPSIQLNTQIDAIQANLIDQAQVGPTFRERVSGSIRVSAVASILQAPFQIEERKELISSLLEHSPETVTLPATLQSHLQQASGQLADLQNQYLDLVDRTQYVSSIIDWLPGAYHAGEFGERPTVDAFVEAVGFNENVDLTAADRDLLVRAFTTIQSQDVGVIPELPLTPEEIEGTLRQVGPNIELTTYGHLTGTVAEMRNFYRALETPELPPNMTDAEFNSFLTVAGFGQEEIDEARSVRVKVREFREQINLETARRKFMRESLPNDPIAIEELLKEARWQRIQSIPTLHLFYPFQAINQYISKPLAGAALYYTTPRTIQRGLTGLVRSTGLQVAEENQVVRGVSRALSNASLVHLWLGWGYDSEEDYNKYQADWDRARATGVNSWAAHRFAFDEWDGHWYQKLILETIADPLSYIGVGILPAITKPLGPIGRGVMNPGERVELCLGLGGTSSI